MLALPVRLAALLAPALLLALLTPAAHASYAGTPGKVAYVDSGNAQMPLKVYTPNLGTGSTVTVRSSTFAPVPDGETPPTAGFPSAPAWSPDGTKLAFAAKVPDDGIGNGATHTAIFVWTLRTGATEQLTSPPAGKVDPNPSDQVDEGFVYTDWAPAWSPDGSTIAFVRFLEAGDDEPVHAQRGGNIRTVPAAGGASTALTKMYGEQTFMGLSWAGPADSPGTLVGYHAAGAISLLRVDPSSGVAVTVLSGNQAALVDDFDVSPDGTRVTYADVGGSAWVVGANGGSSTSAGTLPGGRVRFSPSGNGPLHFGAATVPGAGLRAGLVERRLADPGGDVWPEDPSDKWVNGLSAPTGQYAMRTPGRSLFDVQSQRLPIVALPGFAGSRILCGADELWPPAFGGGNGERLLAMALTEDGHGSAGCAGAGPTPDPNADDGLVSTALGAKVYKPMEEFLDRIAPGDRGVRFSWDWRKAPGDSLARLDSQIGWALNTDFAKDQGLTRVVLFAHSYGGLLARQYVQGHPEKVARVLTAGSPWWGAPKSLFFIAFGVENPVSGVLSLDSFLPNAEAKTYARNLAGAYHLLPSDNYGSWLSIGPAAQDPAGVRSWFTGPAQGNGGLVDAGRAWHQANDGFTTMQGTVEWRAVMGTGLLSITGVDVEPAPNADGELATLVRLGNGDITVPGPSANQGPIGTKTPLGDDIHVQQICGVKHMPMPGDPKVTAAYEDYLLTGRTPRKTEGACTASGFGVKIRKLDLTPGQMKASRAASAAAGGALTAEEAAAQDRIQLIDAPDAPIAVVDDRDPVALDVASGGETVTLEVTRYDGDAAGPTRSYGPLRGAVVIAPGAAGPLVTVDGQPVAPVGGGDPQDPGTGGPGPAPGGDQGDPGPGGPGPGTGGGGAADRTPPRVRFVRVRRDGRVTVAVSEAATLRLTVDRVSGERARTVLRLTRSARAGRITLRVPVKRLGRGKLRLRLVAVDRAGNRSRAVTAGFRR